MWDSLNIKPKFNNTELIKDIGTNEINDLNIIISMKNQM